MHQNIGRLLYSNLVRKERMERSNSSAEIVSATPLMYG
jgi:hypothetical protein